ncbi:Hsp20/alpha crystallin family protein [Pedobacter nyackensis]|uniref:Hsp20/alpha crystallin family protein n=1 Tax=Pedobacter nyackensis TaxID=475255 RepID=UPI00292DBE52|nr:Hsp20/alpha crystallin family protein [Pedobacter nyackensis]
MTTLVKSNAFPSLRSAMEDFFNTDFFNRPFMNTNSLPAVNIRDEENSYELEMAAPGFNKEDFKITSEDGLLTISAETSSEHKEEKKNYTRKEFTSSSFSRSFSLPDNIEEDNVKASYKDGLLTLSLKKSFKALHNKKEISID